jgi:predicted Zn-dependent protease
MFYFIDYRGTIYQFVGYTAPQTFGAFRSAFLQTMEGFGEIQDSRILNRGPVRVSLETVSRTGRLADLIPRNLPAPFKPDEVALLNEVGLQQEIEPGRMLKIPAAHR